MELTGGGNWFTFQKQDIGTSTRIVFVDLEKDVEGSNPAMPPQDILTWETEDGETRKSGLPTALKRVFRNNRVEPGTILDVIYEGKKKGKGPLPFHSFKVVVVDKPGSTAFPPAANEPMADAAMDAKLAAARARRAA